MFSGECALSVRTAESWQGVLSISACDAAEEALVGRGLLGEFTDAQLCTAARVAFDFDAQFFGLDVSWDTAVVTVLASRDVRVAADVRWSDMLDTDSRRAMERLELVDDAVTYAEWQLANGDGVVLESVELDAAAHSSPSIDSMAWVCRASLGEELAKRHLPHAVSWHMHYDVRPSGDGWCGQMRVWAMFRHQQTAPENVSYSAMWSGTRPSTTHGSEPVRARTAA